MILYRTKIPEDVKRSKSSFLKLIDIERKLAYMRKAHALIRGTRELKSFDLFPEKCYLMNSVAIQVFLLLINQNLKLHIAKKWYKLIDALSRKIENASF